LSYTRFSIADFGLPIADCDARPVPDHLVLAVLAEATMMATISCASSIRGLSRFLSIRPALASNSIQYCRFIRFLHNHAQLGDKLRLRARPANCPIVRTYGRRCTHELLPNHITNHALGQGFNQP